MTQEASSLHSQTSATWPYQQIKYRAYSIKTYFIVIQSTINR